MYARKGGKGENSMVKGTPFEVSKEVYDRAKAQCTKEDETSFYMTLEDRNELFPESIRWGYGLYDCKVHEEDGKYICTWWRGSSCD